MFKPTLLTAGLPVLPRVAVLVAAVLTVLILFSWQLFGFRAIQRGDLIDESNLMLRASSTQESGMGLEQVAGLHLFGDVAANVVAPPPMTELPKTDLKLVLVGAMTDSDPQKASALISADNQTRRFYIGDNIPGGAVLHEVLADSVVLKREDRFETLLFPQVGDTGVPIRPKAAMSQPIGRSASTSAVNVAPQIGRSSQRGPGVAGQPQFERPGVEQGMPLRDRLQHAPGARESKSGRQ